MKAYSIHEKIRGLAPISASVTLRIGLGLCCLVVDSMADNDEEVFNPQQHPISRYEHIWKSSPFVAATEVTPSAQPLAGRFALTGFARVEAEDIAFLFDRNNLQRFAVSKTRPENDVSLISVENPGDITALRVKIKAGSEIGEIMYDAGLAAVDAGAAQFAAAQQNAQGAIPPTSMPNAMNNPNMQYFNGNPPPGATGRPPKIIRRRPINGG